ncbi:MAG: DUF370 domain-containing protein [Eubacterium sp.]|nr:DUF370 domain-containing protein [Eubacterium sp.]
MSMLINIGFGNVVNSDKILAVVGPGAAPSKRIVARAKEEGRLIDATEGRKTKSVVIMDHGSVVLSALQPDTITRRFNEPQVRESKLILQ